MRKALLAALLLCAGLAPAYPQSAPRHYLSAATNNSTLVFAGRSLLKVVAVFNTTATVYYLKFYDKVTAPTCGTDTPVLTIPVPVVASSVPIVMPIADGIDFNLGLGFCLVAALADNDNTSAATGVVINLGVTGRP